MGRNGMRLRQDHHQHRRATLALGCALAIVALLGTIGQPVSADSATTPPAATATNPGAGLPVRIKIPAIGVDAAIEYVGLTPDGLMDVPKKWENTAWYQL